MSIKDPREGMQICVHQCPSSDITSPQEAKNFAIHNNSRLCHYDTDIDSYDDDSLYTDIGPCPKLDVYKRCVFLHSRCYALAQYILLQLIAHSVCLFLTVR